MYRQTICLLCILLFSLEKADAYCDLPYKGVNCEQCLCYSINQTCSIYGENICRLSSNTTSSASSTPVWIFFVGPLVILGVICLFTGGYVFCCAFALYCCGALFLMIKSLATSFVEIVVSFFKCKCCHSYLPFHITPITVTMTRHNHDHRLEDHQIYDANYNFVRPPRPSPK